MQRRKVDVDLPASDEVVSPVDERLSSSDASYKDKPRRARFGGGGAIKKIGTVLVILMLVLACANLLLFPDRSTAQKTREFVSNAEREMEGWILHNQQQPSIQQETAGGGGQGSSRQKRTSVDATATMEQQPSSWVDGEKKLKEKLKVLQERQKKGLDLGVPVLTRYLGEDIPAFVTDGVDEAEWRKKVEAKYKQMATEEQEWRKAATQAQSNQEKGKKTS